MRDDRGGWWDLIPGLFTLPGLLGFLPLPPSLDVPVLGRYAAALVVIGCALSITGLLWRDRDDSLTIQQVAAIPKTAGAGLYAIALASNTGSGIAAAAIAIGFTLYFAGRSFHRGIRLHKEASSRRPQESP